MKPPLILPLAVLLLASNVIAQNATPTTAAATPAAPAPLPVQRADVAAPKLDPKTGAPQEGFMKSHESFVAIAKEGKAQLVFLGDSITAGWKSQPAIWEAAFAKYSPANFGIGGDRTQHVLWRIENGEFDGIKPKTVVMMIGTNNSGTKENSAEEVAAGIKKIITAIHKRTPATKILLLAIFPRGATEANNPGRDKNKAVNAIISKYDDGKNVHYLDFGAKFLEADGTLTKEIMPDLLHLNAKSYQIWADAIAPSLEQLMK
jgi:lysophospholipase L1-like esterase